MSTKSTSTRRFAVSSIASGSIVAAVIRQVQIFSDATYVTLLNETTVNNAGGYIQIIGIGFQPGCVVYFNNTLLSSTFISSTVVRATTPAVSNGSYVLLVANSLGTSNNASAIYVLSTSGFPTWTTTSYNSSSVTVSVQLLATGDAPLTYSLQSGSSLPDGTTLSSSGLLSGTIIGATNGIVYSFVVLVDDAELQTTQATITLTIAFTDPYYKNVTLLLNGETAVTPFIQDASTNNFNLVINGDTKPLPVNPYQVGYYSVQFSVNTAYLTTPVTASNSGFGTSDFTVEAWIYVTSTADNTTIVTSNYTYNTAVGNWSFYTAPGASPLIYFNAGGTNHVSSTTAPGNILPNIWIHMAYSRSSSSGRFFINGVQLGTAVSDTSNYQSAAGLLYVGRQSTGNGPLVGYISNLRIVNGTGLYTASFTPSTTPLTAITNTVLLTCQSNRLIDTSNNSNTITNNGSAIVSPFIPFSSPTSVTVNNLYSTFFDGTGDYLTAPSNAVFAFGTSDFTVEGWFYFTGTISTYQRPWWFGDDNDNIEINASVIRVGGASQGTLITGSTTIVANTWYHIALVRSSGSYRLWLNGSQQGSTATNSYNSSARTFTLMATSGGANPSTGYISNLRVVKGIAVYTTTFTPSTTQLTSTQLANVNGNPSAEITGTATSLLTCQNSTIIDNSSYVLTLTPAGQVQPASNTTPFTQTTTTVGSLTTLGSTYFDGTGDYLQVASSTAFNCGTGNFTLEFWTYISSNVSQMFVSRQSSNTGAGNIQWYLYTNASGVIIMTDSTGSAFNNYFSSATIPVGVWSHLAVVRSSGVWYFYLNGVSQAIGVGQDYGASLEVNPTGQPINLGGYPGWGLLTGYMSNFRFVPGQVVYTNNFAPPVQSLTAVTGTSLLSVQYNGGANNSGIIDNSSVNNIITRFGNTSQGTFSPFSQTGWSTLLGYGTYGYQTLPANTGYDITGADFTVEFWANFITWNTMGFSGMTILGNFTNNNGWIISFTGGVGGSLAFNTYISNGNGPAITSTGIVAGTDFQLGTWNHFVVMQKTSVTYFYLNGVMRYSAASVAGVGAGNTLCIGVYQQNLTYAGNANVYYSNMRIIKGTGIYSTAGFTPPTTPLTPIAGTTLLISQSSNLVDNSGLNATITNVVSGVASSTQAFSPFGSIPQATPLSYSNYFDGTGDRLTVPANTAFAFGTGDFTIECWVYLSAYNGFYGSQIAGGHTYSVGADYLFIVNTTGKLYFQIGTSAVGAITSINSVSLNVWTHIALVRISGAVAFYINGANAGGGGTYSTSVASTIVYSIAGDSAGSGATMLTGSISNHRTVKGTGVYTGNFTPPTSPLTATQSAGTNISAITGVQTSLLTCQSTTLIDNSTNAFTITVVGDTVPRIFNPFGYTAQTNSSYSPSVNGGSAYFDGTGDYLIVPATSTFSQLWPNNLTVECWVYFNSVLSAPHIFNIGESTTIRCTLYVSSSVLRFYTTVSTGTDRIISATTLAAGQWYHMAVTKSSGTFTLWLNGVSQGTSTTTVYPYGPPETVALGWQNYSGAAADYLNGYISNFRIVNGSAVYTNNFVPPSAPLTTYSTTTPATLLTNFTSGGIIDYHSSNIVETVGNAQLSTSIKKFGNASMYFDGTGDYLTVPSSPLFFLSAKPFTIELWVYLADATNISRTLVSSGGATGIYLYVTPTGLYYAIGGGATICSATGISSIVNSWIHLAFVREGTGSNLAKIYLNGVLAATGTDANAWSQGAIRIGLEIGSSVNPFLGYLDDLRITNGFARYTGNFNTSSPISPAAAFLTQ